ncbi:hypothetical protein MTO96_041588 [Rhipicephalus appendiculatus]
MNPFVPSTHCRRSSRRTCPPDGSRQRHPPYHHPAISGGSAPANLQSQATVFVRTPTGARNSRACELLVIRQGGDGCASTQLGPCLRRHLRRKTSAIGAQDAGQSATEVRWRSEEGRHFQQHHHCVCVRDNVDGEETSVVWLVASDCRSVIEENKRSMGWAFQISLDAFRGAHPDTRNWL